MRGRDLGVIAVGAAMGAAIAACSGAQVFACESDSDCQATAAEGRCEPNGYCSRPDDKCVSGFQYGPFAGDGLAGECVEPDGGGSTSTTTTGATTTTTTDGTTTDPTGSGSTTGIGDWWDCDWAARYAITLPGADEPLGDTPVVVVLAEPQFDFASVQPGGTDLRLVDPSTQTPLAYEIEDFNPAWTVVWVRVPAVSIGGTMLHAYVGNPDAPPGADPSGTWPDHYAAVWHMDPAIADSTSNANDGAPAGGVAGMLLGPAMDFDGMATGAAVAASPSIAGVFGGGGTISAWIVPDTFGGGGFGRIVDKSSTDTGSGGWLLALNDAGDRLRFRVGRSMGNGGWDSADNVIVVGNPHHVAVTYDADGLGPPAFMINGAPVPAVEVDVPAGIPDDDAATPLGIANRLSGNRGLDGRIDEVRLSTSVRSPADIAYEVRGVAEPASTGPIERSPCP